MFAISFISTIDSTMYINMKLNLHLRERHLNMQYLFNNHSKIVLSTSGLDKWRCLFRDSEWLAVSYVVNNDLLFSLKLLNVLGNTPNSDAI